MSQVGQNPNATQNYVMTSQAFAGVTDLRDFKLNTQGQVEKQSFFEKLGQRISDAFSFSEPAKLAIQERNSNLLVAMQRMVQQESSSILESLGFERTPNFKLIGTVDQELNNKLSQAKAIFDAASSINANLESRFAIKDTISIMCSKSSDSILHSKFENFFNPLQSSTATCGFVKTHLTPYSGSMEHLETAFVGDAQRGYISEINGTPIKGNMPHDYYMEKVNTLPPTLKEFILNASFQGGLGQAAAYLVANQSAIKNPETNEYDIFDDTRPTLGEMQTAGYHQNFYAHSTTINTKENGFEIQFTSKVGIEPISELEVRSVDKEVNIRIFVPNPAQYNQDGSIMYNVLNASIR